MLCKPLIEHSFKRPHITFRFIEIHAHFDTDSKNQEVKHSINANCLRFSLTAVNSSGNHLRVRPVHLKRV